MNYCNIAFLERNRIDKSRSMGNQINYLSVEKNNIPMIRIINKLNGKSISETEDTMFYVI